MKRFIEGLDPEQSTLFPERLEDWVDEDNPDRVIDVFINELDLGELGFDGVAPKTGRPPSSSPGGMLVQCWLSRQNDYLLHVLWGTLGIQGKKVS